MATLAKERTYVEDNMTLSSDVRPPPLISTLSIFRSYLELSLKISLSDRSTEQNSVTKIVGRTPKLFLLVIRRQNNPMVA